MRLWDYRLIPVLPTKMLVSQWRECIAIKRQWEKDVLNHKLVNYVMYHDKDYFMSYIIMLVSEMINRDIKYNNKYYSEIADFCDSDATDFSYYPEHNNRYLQQCYYNLQEKADREIITKDEWRLIHEKVLNILTGREEI